MNSQDTNGDQQWSEDNKEIIVDVEPRNKEFRVAVMKETTVEEVISTLIRRCEDEGIRVSDWGRSKVGQSAVSFVLMRKATGNTAIAPTIMFGELFPELEDRETFKLDARAQVGSVTESDFKKTTDTDFERLITRYKFLYNKKGKTKEESIEFAVLSSINSVLEELQLWIDGKHKATFGSDINRLANTLMTAAKRLNVINS